jgi:hypothetical protein
VPPTASSAISEAKARYWLNSNPVADEPEGILPAKQRYEQEFAP